MHYHPAIPSRRRFLKQSAVLAGGVLALPVGWSLPRTVHPAAPVRIRGRVRDGRRGVAGVAVTDGLSIVDTEANGDFELISNTRQPFVYLTMPAGHAIPQNETGTARFYRPIEANSEGEMQVLFDLAPRDLAADHAFLVLCDPQTQDGRDMGLFHDETVPDVQATVQALGDTPTFGVSCGDIMWDRLDLYPEYERAVSRMGVPFFQVVGNHDLDFDGPTDQASVRTFRRHFGPAYYSFDRGAMHYIVLDDVFWNNNNYFGYIDAGQLAWLEADLARVEAGRTVVVFAHIPFQSTRSFRRDGSGPPPNISITNRAVLYRMLEPYQAHVISGHTHESEHIFEGGVHEHVQGTACGAWWTGPICYDGTPSGYGVYEARGEELRWRYKATGREANHQLRLYQRGIDPAAPDEIVANVWDWDPAWTVAWYEDGMRKGLMARRVGIDPLSERLHRGDDLPPPRPWVEPTPTNHLFYAPISADAGEIRVEATDRFGHTYSAVHESKSR